MILYLIFFSFSQFLAQDLSDLLTGLGKILRSTFVRFENIDVALYLLHPDTSIRYTRILILFTVTT